MIFDTFDVDTLNGYQAIVSIAQGVVTIIAAFLGTVWAVYHFYLAGFRPIGRAWIDKDRRMIKIKIYNKGRTEGSVPRTSIVKDVDGQILCFQWTNPRRTTPCGRIMPSSIWRSPDAHFPKPPLYGSPSTRQRRRT